MATLQISAPKGPAQPAPLQHKETFYKCDPGEIEGVVQAHNDDKRNFPKQWTKWRYEVVLAFDDPDVQGVSRPPEIPPEPKFSLGEKTPGPWRCTLCYSKRYKTMFFGQNPDGAEKCTNCGKSRDECGWSLWMHYNELPPNIQRSVTRQHAPKIISLLRTKWPQCEVTWTPQDNPPSV